MKKFLFCFLFCFVVQATASIFSEFEEPVELDTKTGISNIRGWAFSDNAAITKIELYVDTVFVTNIPSGGYRKDVNRVFPQYSSSLQSGFSMAYNYSNLSEGSHVIGIRIVATNEVKEHIVNFSVTKFNSNFIPLENLINTTNATLEIPVSTSFKLKNVIIENVPVDIAFSFDTATQKFEIKDINYNLNNPTDPILDELDAWGNFQSDFTTLMNNFRSQDRVCGNLGTYKAVPALQWDTALGKAALLHSADMAVHDYFSHEGLDGSSFGTRAYRQGFTGNPVGENIAAGSGTPERAFGQWVGSDGHCANLMSERANVFGTGMGAKNTSTWGYYWTLVLGKVY